MALPDSYRWADDREGSILYLRYGWAATVTPTSVELRGRAGIRLHGPCGSVAQGKRFVERWIEARLRPSRCLGRRPARPSAPPAPLGPDPARWPFSGAPLKPPSRAP